MTIVGRAKRTPTFHNMGSAKQDCVRKAKMSALSKVGEPIAPNLIVRLVAVFSGMIGRLLYESSALSIANNANGALKPESAVTLSVQPTTFVQRCKSNPQSSAKATSP